MPNGMPLLSSAGPSRTRQDIFSPLGHVALGDSPDLAQTAMGTSMGQSSWVCVRPGNVGPSLAVDGEPDTS